MCWVHEVMVAGLRFPEEPPAEEPSVEVEHVLFESKRMRHRAQWEQQAGSTHNTRATSFGAFAFA